MLKLITLIPTKYNDKREVEEKHFDFFEKELVKITGGFTLEGIVQGAWISDNKIYKDESRKYVVAIEETQVEEIKDLLLEMKKRLDQEAMYLEIQDSEIKFL